MMSIKECGRANIHMGWVTRLIFISKTISNHKSQSLKKMLVPTFLFLMIAFWVTSALAAEVIMVPQISAGAAYNDNIYMSETDEESSEIYTVSPKLEVNYESLLSYYSFSADVDVLSYSEDSDLNRTNQYYELTGKSRIKERWETSLDLKYYKDLSFNSYLEETGRVIDRIERDYADLEGQVAYNLTRISGVSAVYEYQNATYDDDGYSGDDDVYSVYSDYDAHQAGLFYYHRLKNEIDRVSIGPSYYHRKNDFNDVDSYSLRIGWKRDWSDIASSRASVGGRYTTVNRNDGSEDDSWGAVANFDLTYDGVVSTTVINYSHKLTTTAEGYDVNVDNFYASYQRWLSERFRIGLFGRIVFSYKLLDQDSDVDDSRYFFIEPRMSYKLTRQLTISLRYRYQNNVTFLDDDEDLDRDRNTIWLQLSYRMKFLL